MVDGANQFLDLKNGLNSAGGTYALTNETSYNCVNPKSSYKCVYQYRGASGGDRIYYNTSTLSMVSQGAYAYPTQNPDTVATVTYALAYAVFEVKSTGTRFLFTTTHLDPPNRTVRVAQWNELIAKVNQMKGDMPVVNVGDYNTQKFDVITQEMLPKMKAAGYGDVLNQSYATNPATVVRAQSTVNGWVNSLNRYDRDVRNYSYPGNYTKTGNSIDWIFASNSLPVRQFKMVSDFDPDTLQVQGVMPSDHNMERATLTMP
jgi:endonuclease/exonuclease/phosphatase family metal-dependent hydrolase